MSPFLVLEIALFFCFDVLALNLIIIYLLLVKFRIYLLIFYNNKKNIQNHAYNSLKKNNLFERKDSIRIEMEIKKLRKESIHLKNLVKIGDPSKSKKVKLIHAKKILACLCGNFIENVLFYFLKGAYLFMC